MPKQNKLMERIDEIVDEIGDNTIHSIEHPDDYISNSIFVRKFLRIVGEGTDFIRPCFGQETVIIEMPLETWQAIQRAIKEGEDAHK